MVSALQEEPLGIRCTELDARLDHGTCSDHRPVPAPFPVGIGAFGAFCGRQCRSKTDSRQQPMKQAGVAERLQCARGVPRRALFCLSQTDRPPIHNSPRPKARAGEIVAERALARATSSSSGPLRTMDLDGGQRALPANLARQQGQKRRDGTLAAREDPPRRWYRDSPGAAWRRLAGPGSRCPQPGPESEPGPAQLPQGSVRLGLPVAVSDTATVPLPVGRGPYDGTSNPARGPCQRPFAV